MMNDLDFIVTDSPLILTHFYGMKYDPFEQKMNTSLNLLKNHHEICKHYGYKVEHYILTRSKDYDPKGRYQDLETAILYDKEITQMLVDQNIKYKTIEGVNCLDMANIIVKDLIGESENV